MTERRSRSTATTPGPPARPVSTQPIMRHKGLPFTWLAIGAAALTAWAAAIGASGWAITAGTITVAAVGVSIVAARRSAR